MYAYFKENNTAYIDMEFIKGVSLQKILEANGNKLTVEQADGILLPLFDALTEIHANGLVHRDIAPDNILVNDKGITKLIDFGASRFSMGEKTQTLTAILKEGYVPIEQYQKRGRQGPYTDLYAFAATYYSAVTGELPTQSIDRSIEDDMISPTFYGAKLSPGREKALMKALSVQAKDRYQTVKEFKADFVESGRDSEADRLADIIYADALEDMKRGRYREASDKFGKIPAWKDSAQRARLCENELKRAAGGGKARKKRKGKLPAGIAVLLLVAAVSFITVKAVRNSVPRTVAVPAATEEPAEEEFAEEAEPTASPEPTPTPTPEPTPAPTPESTPEPTPEPTPRPALDASQYSV